jgi:hypothetical protein
MSVVKALDLGVDVRLGDRPAHEGISDALSSHDHPIRGASLGLVTACT